MLGARAFEVHLCNYWPEWGIKLIDNLAAGRHVQVQRDLVTEAMPFYKLWVEIEKTYTSGDGYLDKRSRRPTPAATAISTSCAWSWWGSIRAAAGRRPATFGRFIASAPARCCSPPACPTW
jgi:hypothetical protein